MATPLDVVMRLYGGVSDARWRVVDDVLAEGALWHQATSHPLARPDGRPWIGPRELHENVTKRLLAAFDGWTVEVDHLIETTATHVIAMGTYRGRSRRSGAELNAPYCMVYRVNGEQIVECWQYTDTFQFHALLDEAPGSDGSQAQESRDDDSA